MFLSPPHKQYVGLRSAREPRHLLLTLVKSQKMAQTKQQDEFLRRFGKISAMCEVTMCHKSARGHKAPTVGKGICNNGEDGEGSE
jgi:hypothetical protein